jgi:hypothetical protein
MVIKLPENKAFLHFFRAGWAARSCFPACAYLTHPAGVPVLPTMLARRRERSSWRWDRESSPPPSTKLAGVDSVRPAVLETTLRAIRGNARRVRKAGPMRGRSWRTARRGRGGHCALIIGGPGRSSWVKNGAVWAASGAGPRGGALRPPRPGRCHRRAGALWSGAQLAAGTSRGQSCARSGHLGPEDGG